MLPTVYSLVEPDTYIRCAAVSAWRPAAVLSHRTAAWLYGWLPEPAVVEATIPRGCASRRRTGFGCYRRDLAPHTVSMVSLLPAVSPAQALFDCAGVMPEGDVASLVDSELDRSVGPHRDLCAAHHGRHGAPAARRLLGHAAFGRELSLRGFPLEANHPIGPYVGDFADEQARIVVEVDGREFHSEPDVFRTDRRRQNWLVSEGWMVLRFAAYDVLAHPDVVAGEIFDSVRRRRRSRRPK
ncbi:conserved hypothetical protein [Rhodococcus jostii RHA1]|uniref:DUF559 domain-containing protein n=1 Tax=Rhodococcus jostii (strain RHA1) TaxID=101510 RepID=Q0S308_RHOJR|nr:DUF559 domain-containing protein [Rhodococcus jostii]ABG98078.1 conserved hypothetical protein [Rhodococcus jostii RHA1]